MIDFVAHSDDALCWDTDYRISPNHPPEFISCSSQGIQARRSQEQRFATRQTRTTIWELSSCLSLQAVRGGLPCISFALRPHSSPKHPIITVRLWAVRMFCTPTFLVFILLQFGLHCSVLAVSSFLQQTALRWCLFGDYLPGPRSPLPCNGPTAR
jgi:hypothetical protein